MQLKESKENINILSLIKSAIYSILMLCFISLFDSGPFVKAGFVEWDASVNQTDLIQYMTQGTYNGSSQTTFSIEQAILGSYGSIYYASLGGTTTTIFSKEFENGTLEWAKEYNPYFIYQKGFLITNDEGTIYSVNDGSTTSVILLKVNATNGSLIMKYEE